MARPIPLEVLPRHPRKELESRLSQAPLDHAEALIAAYEALQSLHDSGALEVLRGALGARDEVLRQVVDMARAPESIRAGRNLLLLARALGEIEPAVLGDLTRASARAFGEAGDDRSRPPGPFKLASTFLDADFRRGLAAFADLLTSFGKGLAGRGR